jgi:drug/metabolite transporter (DMT)-like permease
MRCGFNSHNVLPTFGHLFYATSGVTLPSLVFGLSAGFCYSLYYIFGKFFSTRYTSPNLFFYLLPIGALTRVHPEIGKFGRDQGARKI